jgi:hypothetical protein
VSSYITLGQYLLQLLKQYGDKLQDSEEFKYLKLSYHPDKLRVALKKELEKTKVKIP